MLAEGPPAVRSGPGQTILMDRLAGAPPELLALAADVADRLRLARQFARRRLAALPQSPARLDPRRAEGRARLLRRRDEILGRMDQSLRKDT